MNILLENLELIPQLLEEVKKLQSKNDDGKKWLNSKELSNYIGYSLDAINKMVKENVFIESIHYYKPSKKLLFNKNEIDNWVMGYKSTKSMTHVNSIIDNMFSKASS